MWNSVPAVPVDERGREISSEVVLELRCECCGASIEQRREGRPRRFCDAVCRAKAARGGVVEALGIYNAEQREYLTA